MDAKDIRKAAFAVGLGFTLGKECGDMISAILNRLVVSTARNFAKDGNKAAQKFCNEAKIRYEDPKENISNKVTIGFHA